MIPGGTTAAQILAAKYAEVAATHAADVAAADGERAA